MSWFRRRKRPEPEPERTPAPPADAGGVHPHEPGLVRELREEIEEVVEHVPQPVRWTVGKLVRLTLLTLGALTLIGVVSLALYLVNRTQLVARELTIVLNGTLRQRSDIEVEIPDLTGNPFQHVRLINPRVRYVGDRAAAPLLEAPWIDLRYSPWSFLPGRQPRLDVVVERPVIRVERRADGSLRLPRWKAGAGKGKAIDLRLTLTGGDVVMPKPFAAIEGLAIDADLSGGEGTRVVVRKLAWTRGPYETRDLELVANVTAHDSTVVELRRLRTADFALSGRAVWPAGDSLARAHADVDHLTWRWLARVTGNRSFDVDGQASGTVDAHGAGAWDGRFDVALQWNDLAAKADGAFSWRKERLTLGPMTARSKAGDLDGELMWSLDGWSVGGRVTDGHPDRWGAIGIPGWPEGDLEGRFRYAVDTRRRTPSGSLDATLSVSTIAGWDADEATVGIAFPGSGPDSFTVRARHGAGWFNLDGVTDAAGWSGRWSATDFPLDAWPDGRASGLRGTASSGRGTVTGRDGKLFVTGGLEGPAADWLGARAGTWRLESVEGVLLPAPDLGCTVVTRDLTFLGVHFDSTRIGIRLGDRMAALESAAAFAGDTILAGAGETRWDGKGWTLRLDSAVARSSQFHWRADPPLELAGDPNGVTFQRLVAHDGDATLRIAGRWAGPGGRYDWTAEGDGLDLGRLGFPAEWGLAGRADVTLEVDGASGDPRWRFAGKAGHPGWSGHLADSLNVELDGGVGRLEVKRGAFFLNGGTLEAQGRVHDTAAPWPDTLTADGVIAWIADASVWSGTVTAADLPVDGLGAMAPEAAGWSGRLSGKVEIGGAPGRPELSCTLRGRPLGWKGFAVQEVSARARFANERLEVSELRMVRGDLVSNVHGAMPLRLALGHPPEIPDAPMDWHVDVPNGDLGVLPALVPQVGTAKGAFALAATVAGTPAKPDVQGTVRVTDGILRMAGREEEFHDVMASLRLDENEIRLDTLTARQGDRGRVSGHGVVALENLKPSRYNFDLTMRDCTASEGGVYAIRFDGDFKVADGPHVNGMWLPRVTGDVAVRQAVILLDFANQTEEQQLAAANQPLFWVYRIQVTATNRLYWSPPDGEIEFNANLTIEQTPSDLIIYGEMHALRGTYYFLSNRFDVQQTDLTFDHVDGIDPQINAQAVTSVVPLAQETSVGIEGLSGSDTSDRPHKVTVTIQGRTREPQIQFASDPSDWDEARILRELTLGRYGVGGVALGDPLDHYLTRAINRTLSAEMSRAFRGYINEWQLDRERGGLFGGEGELILGVGTQVTPHLQLRYRQRVPGLSRPVVSASTNLDPFERDIVAEYRLNRFFLVSSELIQRRDASGTTGSGHPDFNVNLKARWEY